MTPDDPLTTGEKVEAAAFTVLLALGMIFVIAGGSTWILVLMRWLGW